MRKTFVILLAVAVVCGGLVHEKGGVVHLSSLDFVPVDADFTEVPDEIGGDGYLELLGIELNVIVGDGVVEV